MARRVIGLDLGAYSVKLVRLEVGKQALKFEIGESIEEILPLDESEEESKDLIEKQREAVLKLAAQGFTEAEAFAIGLEASAGQMGHLKAPALDNRKIEAVLPGLLEQEVPFDVSEMIFSWHRIASEEEARTEDNAEGVDIRIAFGKKQAIARTLQMLQPMSIDPRIMHLSSTASFELVRELGFNAFIQGPSAEEAQPEHAHLYAVVDFGHRATNLCVFDGQGLKFSRTFLLGGKDLTESIAKTLERPMADAVALKHNQVDLLGATEEDARRVSELAVAHFNQIFDQINRALIIAKSSGIGEVVSVAMIGGAVKTNNFFPFFEKKWADLGIATVRLEGFLPDKASSPSSALALGYALSGLQIHAKANRFNFRKDEFAWRGELDFMRAKSVPLILWALVIICSLTVLWSASSLVLEKENQYIEGRLKTACSQILNQKNIAPKKCLTLMKEQISKQVDFGIPEFTSVDLYLKTAEVLPKELAITMSELDVMEKKVRISAETASFADVDKVVAHLSNIPCLVKIERGRAQQVGNVVKFSLSSDFDCNAAKAKSETTPVAPAKQSATPAKSKPNA